MRLSCYCCEDHFDLKADLANYMEYKLTGCRKRLKDNVVPRYFKNITIRNAGMDSVSSESFMQVADNNTFEEDFSLLYNENKSINNVLNKYVQISLLKIKLLKQINY